MDNETKGGSAMPELPMYAKFAATVGRPVSLIAALAMSAPGEYDLARLAGWTDNVAYLMPVCLSIYAACAAVIAATRPKGTRGHMSAMIGAASALFLALAAQVIAHLIAAGHMDSGPWLVAAVSAVPPIVVAHMLHLAAAPKAVRTVSAVKPADKAVPAAKADKPAAKAVPAAKPDTATYSSKPTREELLAAIEVIRSRGHEVNGGAVADHFKVSARTGRRWLSDYEIAI